MLRETDVLDDPELNETKYEIASPACHEWQRPAYCPSRDLFHHNGNKGHFTVSLMWNHTCSTGTQSPTSAEHHQPQRKLVLVWGKESDHFPVSNYGHGSEPDSFPQTPSWSIFGWETWHHLTLLLH